jgi:hypothetical protein
MNDTAKASWTGLPDVTQLADLRSSATARWRSSSAQVADKVRGLPCSKAIERAAWAPEMVIGYQDQPHGGAVIDRRQDGHAATVDELVGDEVERPTLIRPPWDYHRCPRAQG